MGTDAIVLSSGDIDFCSIDSTMSLDEGLIERKLVHRGIKFHVSAP
jgi:hypothetical protein